MNILNKLTTDYALTLLDQGNTLTTPGSNLDTLQKIEGNYEWKGISDQSASILTKDEVITLIAKYRWAINLFDHD